MLTGFSTGCPTGAHEEMLLGFIPVYDAANPMRVVLPVRPVTGCANQYWVFGADESLQKTIWFNEGEFKEISILLDPTRTNHSIIAEPNGQWNTYGNAPFFDPLFALTTNIGKSLNVSWTASSEFIDTYGDSGQLTSWSLSGLQRYSTLRPGGLRATEAVCDVTLTKVSTTRTVTVSLNGIILCQGTRTSDGTVMLSQVNGSGVSGTVAVVYSADVTSGATVTKRYASSYEIALVSDVNLLHNQDGDIIYNQNGQPLFWS